MSNSQTAGSKLTNSVRRAKTAQTDNKVTEEEKKATPETAMASAQNTAAAPAKAPASKPAAKTTARKAPASKPAAKTTTRKAPATKAPAAKPAAKAEKEPEAVKPMGSNRRVWPD